MGVRRFFVLAALGCAVFSPQLRAQGREKRVTPVDAAQRATFERERKVGVAILVGIGKYPRYSGLGELHYPSRDADVLESELTAQRYVVTTLKDGEATRGAILNAIRQSGEVIDAEHGTLVFFFSGHGFAEGNSNYLASYDATSNDLARSGLDLGAVEKAMVATGARRRVMWVDACRNEPGKGAGDGRSFSRFESSSGTRILFSTKAGRISYEDDDLKQGLFSYYLARGLHGEASRDDGMVSFRDLADFVVDGVESRSLKQGRVQVPYEAGESSGDFLLARASAPVPAVIAPKPVASAPAPSGTRSPRLIPGSGEGVMSLAWLPDGRRFVVGTNHGGVAMWDAKSERMIWTVPETADVAITHVAVRADGKLVADTGRTRFPNGDFGLGIRTLDPDTGKLIWTWWNDEWRNGPGRIDSISFSADNHILAAGNVKDGIWGFDAYTGKPLFKSGAVPNMVSSLESLILLFSPKDPRVLYAGPSALMKVDGATGGNFRTISPDFPGGIGAFDVSPRNPDVIWVAAKEGLAYRTMDGGKKWNTVFYPSMGRALWVEASRHDPAVAWINAPAGVYKTTDYGQTWKRIIDGETLNLNVIRENPARRGELIMGSHEGVYIYNDEP